VTAWTIQEIDAARGALRLGDVESFREITRPIMTDRAGHESFLEVVCALTIDVVRDLKQPGGVIVPTSWANGDAQAVRTAFRLLAARAASDDAMFTAITAALLDHAEAGGNGPDHAGEVEILLVKLCLITVNHRMHLLLHGADRKRTRP